MNCRVCGAEVEVNEQRCSKCKEIENNVQVLTLEEKQHFSGITLEQDQQQEEGHYQEPGSYANQQMYTKQFTISNTSLLTKLLLGIILAGLLFVALPIAIVVISLVGIITYIVGR